MRIVLLATNIAYYLSIVFGFLAILASLYSLCLGANFDRKSSFSILKHKPDYHPRVCLIMPCRGNELGLETNIEAALQQAYDKYHMAIVTDSVDDPAYHIAKSELTRHSRVDCKLYTTKISTSTSGKVAALLTALDQEQGNAEVFAFIDSDALIPSTWLEKLVADLEDDSVGATTGFRWYFPAGGGVWSYIQTAWNASGTNLLFNDRYNFPWGGAMAIRAETLEKIHIRQVWADAISDDLALNCALRKYGYKISFLPQCTVSTFSHTDRDSFLSWAIRQTALTRVYNRRLWNYALTAYAFLDVASILGVILLVLGITTASAWLIPAVPLLTPSAFGIVRSVQRNSTFRRAMPDFDQEFRRTRVKEAIASLIVPWIMTYCIIKSAATREIDWRGRRYKLAEMKTVAPP